MQMIFMLITCGFATHSELDGGDEFLCVKWEVAVHHPGLVGRLDAEHILHAFTLVFPKLEDLLPFGIIDNLA